MKEIFLCAGPYINPKEKTSERLKTTEFPKIIDHTYFQKRYFPFLGFVLCIDGKYSE
jgi:hypothetical protein